MMVGLLTGAVLIAAGSAAAWYMPRGLEKAGFDLTSWIRGGNASMVTASTARETQVAQATPKDSREAVGEGTTTTTRTFGGWTVTCSEGGNLASRICTASFRVINKQNNANVLVWVIGRNAQGKLLSEFMTLSDVIIPPGVTVAIEDDAPAKAEFIQCTTRGCMARLEMSEEMIGRLKGATRATIAMTRVDGQVIQFQMEIPGIGDAMGALGV